LAAFCWKIPQNPRHFAILRLDTPMFNKFELAAKQTQDIGVGYKKPTISSEN
jgi:hypothetical protein